MWWVSFDILIFFCFLFFGLSLRKYTDLIPYGGSPSTYYILRDNTFLLQVFLSTYVFFELMGLLRHTTSYKGNTSLFQVSSLQHIGLYHRSLSL